MWMTQRRRLDAFLLDAARERGVDVREGARVAVDPDNSVLISGERFTADALIGADGANGVTAKAVGLGAGDRLRRRVRGERQVPEAAARAVRESARARAGGHPRRLRVGVSEGRPRERRRRRLAERGPEAARASQARLRGSRSRAGGSRGAARTPASAAAARVPRSPRAGNRRRGRRRPDRPGLGRRHVRVLRLGGGSRRRRSWSCSPDAPRRCAPTSKR